MSKVIDLEGGRRGKAEMRRAVELGKARGDRPARAVPIAQIITNTSPMSAQTFTVEELAGIVRLATITIRRDIRAGKLQAANGGGKSAYRISRSDAETWWRGRGGGALLERAANNFTDTRTLERDERNEIARDLDLLDELEALAAELTADTPPLADDAVERAYTEREAAQL
jgi:excisionase family DNA binding protein